MVKTKTTPTTGRKSIARTPAKSPRGGNCGSSVGGIRSGGRDHRDSTPASPEVQLSRERREARARRRDLQRRLDDAERRAACAEKERDALLGASDGGNQPLVHLGMEMWQDVWHKEDTSSGLTFPTAKSVICKSVEEDHENNCMPGVHTESAMWTGRTTQSIWFKGRGYTLAGLVSSDEEKKHVRRHAGIGWDKLRFMRPVCHGYAETEGAVVTINVDMVSRRAELFLSRPNDSNKLEQTPQAIWTDLPDKVWVAVAFKRNSAREAVLMPCMHWAAPVDLSPLGQSGR
uniref:Uncharacterized protein n=1 Tax=Trieres chinensis TaxID=1514140 RepID=A0A7S1ZNI0_TRICV|mmetsp:Transcript_29678/g.60610  ORF Transcript_29678/g.60610 Transcript_29678/m.60610 type:complete len:288 (+) Transcript_29678:168-1031(+)